MRLQKSSQPASRLELHHDLRAGDIPRSEDAVLIAAEDEVAGLGGGEGLEEGGGAGELFHFTAIAGDEAELGITGAGGDLIGGAEVADAGDLFVPAIDALAAVAGGPVPDFDDIVRAAAGKQTAIGTPGKAEHMMRVAFKDLHDLAVGEIGDADGFVGTAGGKEFAVGREIEREDAVEMTLGVVLGELASGDVPQRDVAAAGGLAAADGEGLAIG